MKNLSFSLYKPMLQVCLILAPIALLLVACRVGDSDSSIPKNTKQPTSLSPQNTNTQVTTSPRPLAIQLVSNTWGWVLTDQSVLVTADGGKSWKDITPPQIAGVASSNKGIFFLDPTHGWIVVPGERNAESAIGFTILRTIDGGKTWDSHILTSPDIVYADSANEPAYIDFLDSLNGWVVMKIATGINFSRGDLYRTSDGGVTWKKLNIPIGDAVHFSSSSDGWTVGGPGNNQIFVSHDGGENWSPESILLPPPAKQAMYDLPVFQDTQHGTLPVTFEDETLNGSGVGVYTTADAGKFWKLSTRVTPTNIDKYGSGTKVPIVIVNPTSWLIATNQTLIKSADQGKSWTPQPASGLPESITQIAFSSSMVGWALGTVTTCGTEPKNCTSSSVLVATSDGGTTWTSLTPLAPK